MSTISCCCSHVGTDLDHSGLRSRLSFSQRQDSSRVAQQQLDKAEASAREGRADGCCVSFDGAPGYLRREFIMSGYYIGTAGWTAWSAPD